MDGVTGIADVAWKRIARRNAMRHGGAAVAAEFHEIE
jgi:hypothetical protein